MKHLFPVLFLFALALAGCSKKEYAISAKRKAAIIDSLVGLKAPDIHREADEDLDRRSAIEVKAKTDSILMARAGKAVPATADTPGMNDQPFLMNDMQRRIWERKKRR